MKNKFTIIVHKNSKFPRLDFYEADDIWAAIDKIVALKTIDYNTYTSLLWENDILIYNNRAEDFQDELQNDWVHAVHNRIRLILEKSNEERRNN